MVSPDARQGAPHLFAGLIAFGLVAAVLFGAEVAAVHLEHETIPASAPELFPLKNQGLAFQRAAAHAPYVLPLYGSSEFTAVLVPERAQVFFRTAPTGFQVSPVGAGGANSLIILQKIGALGSDLRGKKVAISLSPGWFLKPGPGWTKGYRGNFSLMAASEMVFGSALDFDLKRDIALRMLKCPSTLEGNPLLESALKQLASGGWLDRVVFWTLWPLGKVQTAILELQDHFAAFHYIRHKIGPAPLRHPETPDWPKLIASATGTGSTDADKATETSTLNEEKALGDDVTFQNDMNAAPGWIDFELLLRTLARVHARPLLLSMPIAGDFYDERGISRSARENYYVRLRALVQRYRFPLVEFKAHDEDPAFLYLHKSHLTAKGWIYYDRALDDFFQGRAPRS
ncbi:MAG TPA: D-alanyl-lipoteichoic acid biosynthesis protein DltD [Candidatus Udaeobacter sp.]|nr:D-alanyl-lipoteichoic acid biosynthesis protein DltD [Candidatus Udaeobacter sp.]